MGVKGRPLAATGRLELIEAGPAGTQAACSLKQAERDRQRQNTHSVWVLTSTNLLDLISLCKINCTWDLHVLGLLGELRFWHGCVQVPASGLRVAAFRLHHPAPGLPQKAYQEGKASSLVMIQHKFGVYLENHAWVLLD